MRKVPDHIWRRRYLLYFLLTASFTPLVTGLIGKMPFFFSFMFTTIPLFASIGIVFDDGGRSRSRGHRIAEVVVAVVLGITSIVMAIYGFLGLY